MKKIFNPYDDVILLKGLEKIFCFACKIRY